MKFEVAPLPYAKDALEPHISARTLEFHYEKHHKGYMSKLKDAIENTDLAGKTLHEVILNADKPAVFNPAAQVWNHSFYWDCMKSSGGGAPSGDIAKAISDQFGSVDDMIKNLKQAANGQFGSGWAWLVKDKDDKLSVMGSANAENPLTQGLTPLLTIDVWEHAYYLDYQNNRAGYVDMFFDNLVNWEFVESNLKSSLKDVQALYG